MKSGKNNAIRETDRNEEILRDITRRKEANKCVKCSYNLNNVVLNARTRRQILKLWFQLLPYYRNFNNRVTRT